MKIIKASNIFLFLCLVIAPEVLAAHDGLKLSLQEALGMAFKNNKDIQIQERQVQAARANILGSRSAFLPKVDLNAVYTRNGAVLPSSGMVGKKEAGVFTGYKDDNRLGVSIAESVYNGGANVAGFNQARLNFKIQEESLRAMKLDVDFEARRLYYGLLLAQETERIASELLNQAREHYEEVKANYAQGTSSRFDLLQSKVQVSKVEPEFIKAKNSLEIVSAQLRKLLGMNINEPLELKDKLEYSPFKAREEELLKTAYLNKPEMVLRALGVDLSLWGIRMARSFNRPQVEALLNYDYRSRDAANMINPRHNNWSAGVAVTVPIFDGFSSKAKVDEAKARYAQSVLSKDNLAEQIAVDIRRGCLDLKKAEAIINSQKDSIDEAKEALRIAQVSYEFGEGKNLDVLDAQVSLSQVKKNLSEGIYDYLMAEAYLDRTMGKCLSPSQ